MQYTQTTYAVGSVLIPTKGGEYEIGNDVPLNDPRVLSLPADVQASLAKARRASTAMLKRAMREQP